MMAHLHCLPNNTWTDKSVILIVPHKCEELSHAYHFRSQAEQSNSFKSCFLIHV